MTGYSFVRREDSEPSRPSGEINKPVLLKLEPDSREKTSGQKGKSRSRYPAGDMDVLRMLAEMREERARIEEAIIVLERLAGGKRRGRPPAWMAAASAPKRRGRPPGGTNQPKNKAADRG